MPTDPPTDELSALRAEVARLQAQLDQAPGAPGPAVSGTRRPLVRTVISAMLIVIACILAPAFKSRYEQRFGGSALYAPIAAVWPVAGFLLSFALIASREAVPFLYFQF